MDIATEKSGPHNILSPKLGFAGDEKLISGLSTFLVASIQEAKDRISQIEFIFCSQLYPHFQSSSKLSDSKRHRIEELEELLRSKESKLESETTALLGRIDELEGELRVKTREVEELEMKRVENDVSYRKLVEQVESLTCELQDERMKRVENDVSYRKLVERVELLTCELQDERMKRNDLNEAFKRLKSQHIYLRQKVGLTEENMICKNKSLECEGDFLAKDQSPIIEPGLEFEDPDITMGACKTDKVKSEIAEEDFGGLAFEDPNITMGACKEAKMKKSEIPEEDFGGLEKRTPEVFVAACDTNEVKEKALEDDKRANLNPPSSSFHGVSKCPSSTKLGSVSGTKRPAPSWRQTRSHQSRAGPDLHDDFLDTPLENIRENLNKDLYKEDLPCPIQKDISMDSSDDETQDMNAKSSPQKKQSSMTVANKRSFKYIEPVRKKAERENLKGVECKQCRKFYDAVLPNADGKDPDDNKQNLRCEHHDGVSRHRYRYVPPMTPEGFWNIGFESEIKEILKETLAITIGYIID